jgi:hypothetical protein
MRREALTVHTSDSGISESLGLILTVRAISEAEVDVIVGFSGLPNLASQMQPGDAVLFETASEGLFEIRLLSFSYVNDFANFLLTEVSPRVGLIAGAADIDPANAPFTEEQLGHISRSVQEAQVKVAKIQALRPEQIELLDRKLEEIRDAATRMGRKDWVNYVAGSLTSVCIAGAFAPEVTRNVFHVVNAAFAWLFSSGILLIQ